jgi:hypothetical protein
MDGNGRWAAARGLPRTAGHAAGESVLFEIVHAALDLGIEWLTVFTFSTENWSRPQDEVDFLMGFKEDLLMRRRDELHELGVRVRFLGDRDDLRVSDRLRDPDPGRGTHRGGHLHDDVFAFWSAPRSLPRPAASPQRLRPGRSTRPPSTSPASLPTSRCPTCPTPIW